MTQPSLSVPKRSVLASSVTYVSLFLMSCATPPTNPTGQVTTATPTNTMPTTLPMPNAQVSVQQTTPSRVIVRQDQASYGTQTNDSYGSFSEWKQQFLRQTGNNQLFANASLNQQVITLDSNQAEFSKMPWEYLDSAVSTSRVNQGIQKRREQLSVLDRAETRYGVPASIVTAIWGIESSYGAAMGSTDLVNALSSLAYEGRRRSFAENQLLSMLQMVNRGDVASHQLKGSWAGGMGHTQFIPSTWLAQGVDGDGDGRKNPFTAADALTSTANYLSNSGWVAGLPAYFEVGLPQNFDYRHIGASYSLDTWRSMGVYNVGGGNFSGSHTAELWLPAGVNGPVLLITKNFNVIKVYNNSSNYALAVAALANRINSRPAFVQDFPRHEQPLSRGQVQQLQQILTSRGFDTKGADGVIGTNTRNAFAQWQAANGRIPDGFISQSTVRGLLW